ncbi:MAG: tRNA lysidine(34) synthetase TilS [Armatimonadota bacterium]|nr:tRNA lysidine(34) synthetase TilS [Armatimonadota bacterium]
MRGTIETHRMIAAGDLVVVALSGGPDSTALLHALVQIKGRHRFRLRVAHVHHGIREADADTDARAAAAFARKVGVPFSQHRADVPAYAESHGLSMEAAAREVRYRLLESTANRFGANRIATGHTANDQAETILLNLLRGTGPRGLAGIPPVRGRIIRPLLGVTREAVQHYCDSQQLPYRIDASNRDVAFARNRVRHELMPVLERFQPTLVSTLSRLAEIMRAEDDLLSEQADNALRGVASQRPGEVGILLSLFGALPSALQRRVIRAAIAKVKGDELDIELERVDALLHLALEGRTGALVELPGGLRAERTYGEVVIAPAPTRKAVSTQEWTLPVPGRVLLRDLGFDIAASRSRAKRPPPSPMAALLNAAKIGGPLRVRTRRRGDRFRPIGMKGTVKLQDFFVNAKVPRAQRDGVPLVLSGDEIVWVVGYRVSEGFKVTEKTRRSIRLEATRLT